MGKLGNYLGQSLSIDKRAEAQKAQIIFFKVTEQDGE